MASMNDDPFEDRVIDIKPSSRRRRVIVFLGILVAVLFLFGSQLLAIYIDAIWFSSLGFAEVYWYKFRLGGALFAVVLVVSFGLVRLPFVFLTRLLPELSEKPRFKVNTAEDLREVNLLPFLYRPAAWVLPAIVGLLSAINLSQRWSDFALYLNSQKAGQTDPIFGKDVAYYLFELPVWQLVSGWLQTLSFVVLAVVAISAGYVWYLDKLRGVLSNDTRRRAVTAISYAGALFALVLGLGTWLDRFDLLETKHELFTGISYTDAHYRLPAMNFVVILLAASALLLLANAIRLRQLRLIIWPAAAVAAAWLIGVIVLPQIVYSLSVKPNELARESPYIEHNIKLTREAFGLDRFEERPPYQPKSSVELSDVEASRETLENVRLWDRAALSVTLSGIQEIRTYYEFRLPDVDRYKINGKLRQVMLSTREMNLDQLPDQSRNWINEHLVYTHGYGVTMNTVNEVTPEGLPNLILKNMPVESSVPEIKVTRPEVYFGEATKSHVYVRTTQPEFNYPASGDTESYTSYEGGAGLEIGGFFRKLALSLYLGDGTNLILSNYINSESRVLIRRQIRERVSLVAPFLLFEDDPYMVIGRDGRLSWIIDAFTTSDRYPYSTTYAALDREVNYIRNSVKVIVDAYDGSVKFYVFEPEDPVIRAYQRVFPAMFLPKDQLPEDLLEHVRYPNLLMNVQARVYSLYHMQNTQTFYNHEDLWAIAAGEPSTADEAPAMQPYHVLMQLPGEQGDKLEFVSILPFTPVGPGRSNMIGWMAARSDGPSYGSMLVFTFPKNVTINGPAQIRARVNQDPVISPQMTLLSSRGSQLLRGNLLVIPLAESLLYVEPFFLQAEGKGSKLPELRFVAVATQERLASGKNFEEALKTLLPSMAAPQQPPPADTKVAPQPGAPSKPASPVPGPSPAVAGDVQAFRQQVRQLLADYERLTAEGKHGEAGLKLDQLKRLLEGGQR